MTPPLEQWLAEVEKRNNKIKSPSLANHERKLLVKLLRKCMEQRDETTRAYNVAIEGAGTSRAKLESARMTEVNNKELTDLIKEGK